MTGWERLTAVIAVLFGSVGFFLGYISDTYGYATFYPSAYIADTYENERETAWRSALSEVRQNMPEALDGCDPATTETTTTDGLQSVQISCDKTTRHRINLGITYAAIPVGLLYLLLFTITWIREGFRGQRK